MARILSQTLIRESQCLIREPSPSHLLSGGGGGGGVRSRFLPPSSRLLNLRGRSGRPEKVVQLLEVDLEPAAEESTAGGDVEVSLGMRRLEEAIHGIVIRRSAPEWLPFIPGSSYWVPPRKKPYGVGELIGRLANPMTEEETMSFTTIRGWPCVEFLAEGISPHSVEKRPKVATTVQSDDE